MAISSLNELTDVLKQKARKFKIAVACGNDANTINALYEAADNGFATPVLIGDETKIQDIIKEQNLDGSLFNIIDEKDDLKALNLALKMVKNDEADVLMKGLIGTDKFLHAVLNKENGLMKPKAVMSYVCAVEVPKYHKLLFVTDTAVLPYPDLSQKIAMLKYSIAMAKQFGIEKPKVALIGASEKINNGFQNSNDYAVMCKMVERGQLPDCIIDGPLDIFLACDKESVAIKGVSTPVNGDADILLFPNLEACNSFYKGLMLFAGGELAGLIQGTEKPVVVMSRSESEKSKYYCVALACLMCLNK
ncbi:MAG: phosphate acyltransferase [Bacteroidales bacterium]|nr:phosphate acyltransferase [Bacteroidales bacterium]MDD2203798.1 phosphate acyltransferase [Bacteroidales bacterium]MDD3913263.1 phosphate acyltransferase [Bacteroidales bacterium]MDD4633294.1 phosphate acyltransferase [Bacteroidales bacterium]